MMTSLFSSFDPSSKMMQMNWMIMLLSTMLIPMTYWANPSRTNKLKKIMEKKMSMEMWNNTKHKEMLMMTASLFIMILTNNMMGLFPYTFTPTSHPSVTLALALPTWTMMMIYGWSNHTKKMFIHLLPSGTPSPIMPMMILIETVGNLIRPMSLSIRLTANMIAGHLLMTLLGNMNESKTLMMILPMKMMLMSFETAISMIQAYVFATLVSLYSSELP
uniref:ATP synthase subunit a n=1 Tax=Geisha distinctissima TaxID=130583 RepID=C3TX56_9HEMI|nr:ATP synthase F0 subunit 6 [Geisha distinctissima]ACI28655.1 ATP synthase F0 subunit 6 [Geisha distinctissima]